MVKRRRHALAGVSGLGLVVALLLWARGQAPAPVEAGPQLATNAARGSLELPRIDLARLDAPRGDSPAGQRDVFDFGAAPKPPKPAATAVPPAASVPLDVDAMPTPPPVPQLSVKFIGSVENKKGLRVAVLLTDKKEILTGQAGEVVGNRLKIVKIGLESVDVQDVAGGSVRRIPLRGN